MVKDGKRYDADMGRQAVRARCPTRSATMVLFPAPPRQAASGLSDRVVLGRRLFLARPILLRRLHSAQRFFRRDNQSVALITSRLYHFFFFQAVRRGATVRTRIFSHKSYLLQVIVRIHLKYCTAKWIRTAKTLPNRNLSAHGANSEQASER